MITHRSVSQQLDDGTALEQWGCTRPRFLAGQLLRFGWMRTNSDGQEIALSLSKRLFHKEMRGTQRLCRGTFKRISLHAFGGELGGSSNGDGTFVVAVLAPLSEEMRQF